MYITPLNCGDMSPWTYAVGFCAQSCGSVIYKILHCKLAENPVITPSTSNQVVAPSSKGRYLQSVTVKAVSKTLDVTPSSSVQTFTDGPYSTVTVQAES